MSNTTTTMNELIRNLEHQIHTVNQAAMQKEFEKLGGIIEEICGATPDLSDNENVKNILVKMSGTCSNARKTGIGAFTAASKAEVFVSTSIRFRYLDESNPHYANFMDGLVKHYDELVDEENKIQETVDQVNQHISDYELMKEIGFDDYCAYRKSCADACDVDTSSSSEGAPTLNAGAGAGACDVYADASASASALTLNAGTGDDACDKSSANDDNDADTAACADDESSASASSSTGDDADADACADASSSTADADASSSADTSTSTADDDARDEGMVDSDTIRKYKALIGDRDAILEAQRSAFMEEVIQDIRIAKKPTILIASEVKEHLQYAICILKELGYKIDKDIYAGRYSTTEHDTQTYHDGFKAWISL